MTMSANTRSIGSPPSRIASARSAFSASRIAYPSVVSCSTTSWRSAGLSSTTRIVSPPAAPRRRRHRGRRALVIRDRAGVAGQVEAESRADTWLAVDIDVATRLLEEAEHHAEPEPGAFAAALGGEERIEDLRHDIGRHAD